MGHGADEASSGLFSNSRGVFGGRALSLGLWKDRFLHALQAVRVASPVFPITELGIASTMASKIRGMRIAPGAREINNRR
jgi:hypothetical protein